MHVLKLALHNDATITTDARSSSLSFRTGNSRDCRLLTFDWADPMLKEREKYLFDLQKLPLFSDVKRLTEVRPN